MPLRLYPDKFFYRIDFNEYENGQIIRSDSALLHSIVPISNEQIRINIRSLIKNPLAVIKIFKNHLLARDAFIFQGGILLSPPTMCMLPKMHP